MTGHDHDQPAAHIPSRCKAGVWKRIGRIAAGAMVLSGVVLSVLAVQAAAMGLHGYGDVFAFLSTLGGSTFLIALGWELIAE